MAVSVNRHRALSQLTRPLKPVTTVSLGSAAGEAELAGSVALLLGGLD